jgi:hypothetical protein
MGGNWTVDLGGDIVASPVGHLAQF